MNPRPLTVALVCALALPASGAIAAAQEPPPAPADAPPAADGAAPADAEPPQLVLGGRRWQRLAPVLETYATCSERCEFDASARVAGVPGLRYLRVVTPAKAGEGGTRMRFELRVSRRAHKLISEALSDAQRVVVEVDVTAYDLADNSTERTRRIRVVPPGPPGPPGPAPIRRS
ncbi:MAG TPA: hypothetical protein VF712_00765 [Thermoleophilaceae bacterium]